MNKKTLHKLKQFIEEQKEVDFIGPILIKSPNVEVSYWGLSSDVNFSIAEIEELERNNFIKIVTKQYLENGWYVKILLTDQSMNLSYYEKLRKRKEVEKALKLLLPLVVSIITIVINIIQCRGN